MYPIFNKIGFNRNRGIKYTYFELKYSLRVSLRVEQWSSVIYTYMQLIHIHTATFILEVY